MKKILKIFLFIAVIGAFIFFAMRNQGNLSFFDPLRVFFKSLFQAHTFQEKITSLTIENQLLRNEVEVLKNREKEPSLFHYKTASVYSRYPSNDRSLVIISIGAEDGIVPGMPVMVRQGVLFGKVKSVARTQSEIETIFSPQWKSSVFIGSGRAKAVLRGGNIPTVELISKEESVKDGDVVSNSSPEFPLSVSIGSLQSLTSPSNEVWQSATVDLPYDIQDINSVFVLIDFP